MDANQTVTAPAKQKKKESWAELARFMLLLFVAAIMLRSFVFAPFSIPSGSMLPKMMIGDFLFVAKWPYGFSRFSFPFGLASFDGRLLENAPERGDVIVFRHPDDRKDMVKRLIGLPGDQIQMRGGALFLNGAAVPKVRIADYLMPVSPNSPCRWLGAGAPRAVTTGTGARACAYPRYRETLPGGRSYFVLDQIAEGPGDDTEVFLVPEGHVFMMGDNRDDSLDSRFPQEAMGVGYLPEEHLIGRAMIDFFSTDGSAEWIKPWTWLSAARWTRIGTTFE